MRTKIKTNLDTFYNGTKEKKKDVTNVKNNFSNTYFTTYKCTKKRLKQKKTD